MPNDAEATPPKQATCAVVGIVSPNQLFLELHGNYNPTFEKTTLETLKAQFQLVSPTLHPEFKIDFNLGIGHLKTIQRNAIKEGPTAQHFVVSDGLKKALKFSSPLFEKRVSQNLIYIVFLIFKLIYFFLRLSLMTVCPLSCLHVL